MSTLTIILGKNIGRLVDVDAPAARCIFFPEITLVNIGRGPCYVPQHADDFVPQVLSDIAFIMPHKSVQLWTQSEYLVSWICQAAGEGKIPAYSIEIRLYADDNSSFRKFAVSEDGVMCADGDGDWPFGWFMPSDFKY